MRTIFFILILASCLSSCKKEYTCQCTSTITYTYPSAPPPSTSTSNTVYKVKKQSEAQTKCDGQESSQTNSAYQASTTCDLK